MRHFVRGVSLSVAVVMTFMVACASPTPRLLLTCSHTYSHSHTCAISDAYNGADRHSFSLTYAYDFAYARAYDHPCTHSNPNLHSSGVPSSPWKARWEAHHRGPG